MQTQQKYNVDHKPISFLISSLENKLIAIPDIQRPFVWDGPRVLKLIDSLYKGYPVGYIVTSINPNVKLKDGTISHGKTILIDGQQRITALSSALLGWEVTTKDYSKKVFKIAFNPKTKVFLNSDAPGAKDKSFIPDISVLFNEKSAYKVAKGYVEENPDMDMDECMEILYSVQDIKSRDIGIVELASDLDMDSVTEIFNRINSQGVPLKEADFAMSKIAADENYGGNIISKCIYHFSELVKKPEMYGNIEKNDKAFVASPFFNKISWLKHENDDIYDPSYEDMLRVILIFKFQRGKMGDLVQMLSGRNFKTKTYEQEVKETTFATLKTGVYDFINEHNFKTFVMLLSSGGFCNGKITSASGAKNFAYALFLYLRSIGYAPEKLQNAVLRWFVMSLLTGRYSSSSESRFESDIKRIVENGIEASLSEIERTDLSEVFWTEKLVANLGTSTTTNAAYNVYFAAQCKKGVRGLLSKQITVKDMITQKGDIHHIFPRQYLIDHGMAKTMYNQVANFAYVQTEINIQIGKKAPNDYFGYVVNEQVAGGETKYGGITDIDDLKKNMQENCIPEGLENMDVNDYQTFLSKRRVLMANAIREYYTSL